MNLKLHLVLLSQTTWHCLEKLNAPNRITGIWRSCQPSGHYRSSVTGSDRYSNQFSTAPSVASKATTEVRLWTINKNRCAAFMLYWLVAIGKRALSGVPMTLQTEIALLLWQIGEGQFIKKNLRPETKRLWTYLTGRIDAAKGGIRQNYASRNAGNTLCLILDCWWGSGGLRSP